MSNQPIRIGIIGTGIFAHRHHRAYQSVGNDKFQIVACANRSKEKALAFAKEIGIDESAVYTNFTELINDPNVDAVDVILPVQFNKEVIEAAIAANKHVMFEKPIAASLKDAREIVLLSQKTKTTVVAVNENWSYHPLVNAVAEYVRDGGIGEIVNFTYDSARPYNPNSPYHSTKWRQNPLHPGGYLSDGCVHDMAHLVPILGKFTSVAAFATKRHKVHVLEDTLATTIKLENGGVGVANFTFCSAGVKKMTLFVHGTEGSIELIDETTVNLFDKSGKPVDISPITSLQSNSPGNGLSDVEGELAAFYNAVRHGKKLGVSTEEAFHHLAFIVAALEYLY
ncbi:uncharacterized protein BX663DRAFT_511618 [Cokeromyces recurvatus]|uniref:uncharacterized protein n=1 Tax=Cokeromyces recurvatus TaxID=90255 RepID=UPI00221EF3BB|nr:uncharacterized protein BX663DRAFT_511618 [Cokeromyces recurvatus]KAI7902055.1 hypothetical protein BX663DRAFT_511618 [Cokeromyces recurvatus]